MRNKEAGFTLIEVLISTSLTLLVMGAGISTFTRSVAITETARLVGSTNHGMQAAMSMMIRDFMQTGRGIPIGGIPIPSGVGAVPIIRPAPPGPALTLPAAWLVIPAASTGGSLGPMINGVRTDMVSILSADPLLALNQFPLTAIAANGSTMTVNAGTPLAGVNGLRVGDLIMFSNAIGNAIQTVTAVNGQVVTFAVNDPFRFNNRAAAQGTIIQLQQTPGVYPPTTATRLLMVTYYVDATTDPALPRLVRQVNHGTRLAIALGVENLQLTYDLVDGITNPSNVETPIAPFSPSQIRKANLFVSARSLDKNMSTNQYMRNSMAVSVGLRSLSFVDRYR